MSQEQGLLREAALRIFRDHAPGGLAWPSELWRSLQQAGFDRALSGETGGGAALQWADAFSLLFVAGAHAAAVPLAEAMIGHWLLEQAGLPDQGLISIAPRLQPHAAQLTARPDGYRISGTLARVPWGRACAQVVTVFDGPAGPLIVLIDCQAAGVSIVQGSNLAGEPRDTLVLSDVAAHAVAPSPVDVAGLLEIVAVARSAQMAGAIERILSLAVDYAKLREQFGRPIGKFQAVAQNIAVLATQAVAARAATDAGAEAIDDWFGGANEPLCRIIACASAKIRAGEAAGHACAITHQVFGAIGFTQEHELHHYTKRLWSWREECGNEAYWAKLLGECVLASPVNVWRTIANSTAHADQKGRA